MRNYLKVIEINPHSSVPKYQQLYNSLLGAIEDGRIVKGDALPSISDLTCALSLSKNTIERAYQALRDIGVLKANQGKGFYIAGTDVDRKRRILVLFNTLSEHKKYIYESFVANVQEDTLVELCVYNDIRTLERTIEEKGEYYSKILIIPPFEDTAKAINIINSIPNEKLLLIDKFIPELSGNYPAVYQNFELDLLNALSELWEKIKNYRELKFVFPNPSYESTQIVKGLQMFSEKYRFKYSVIYDIAEEDISKGAIYVTIKEEDLVTLIEKKLDSELQLGKDFGIISYNETPLKGMILNGITTISTDFKMMGKKAAEIVNRNESTRFAVPFSVTLRNSL